MPKVNSNILRWAREKAELSPEEAVKKLSINDTKNTTAVNRLYALEHEGEEPSRAMLLRMAKIYRRPLLTFYMSTPPKKGNRGQDFRTLPHDRFAKVDVIIDALIRDICARQSMIRAALEDEEEADTLPFIGSKNISDGRTVVLEAIHKLLQLDLDLFYNASSPSKAFSLLRAKTEEQGIFVLLKSDLGSYHTAIEPKLFRGFAHADDIAPFIVINNQDSKRAWSFTLIHELTHLLLGQTGISGFDSGNKIEKFCNDVASEFLLPKEILASLKININTDYKEVETRIIDFAKSNNLSNSMISYKLFRNKMISKDYWERLSKQFRELWQKNRSAQRKKMRESESGPSYYIIHRQHIGASLINLVQRMMAIGALTTSKAGKVLGVKATNVQNIIGIY